MNYRNTAQRLASLLAAMALVLSLVPAAVFAHSPDDDAGQRYQPAISSMGDVLWVKGITDDAGISVSLTGGCPEQPITLRAEIGGLEETASGRVDADGTVSISFDFLKEKLNSLADGDYPIQVSADENEYHCAILKTKAGTLKVSAPTESPADKNAGQPKSIPLEQNGLAASPSPDRKHKAGNSAVYATEDIAVINQLID